ncbi:hypothetical protein H8B06_08740 [Sphingobacterium sp. DN00404]|uniref:HEAT repeat domain-containing protein n=1 Tax=Sphingobacterium micropteri TaxID=2763501 RepID=A0ABR7YNJ2_9SPHI|nr:hypothetical protein [Sphingobacterium micropteri]MBD1432909.1 hypothetical protein [Sphingobacterium micropteri]
MGLLLLISIPLCSIGQTKEMALADLKSLLYSEKEWVKVHVAEFLLWENCYVDEVRVEFLKEEEQFGHIPKYRIGIWRVLVQAATDEKNKQYWIDKIMTAYRNPEGEDRLHAIETLAKLQVGVVQDLPTGLESSFRLYSLWNYTIGSAEKKQTVKNMLLQDLVSNKLTELERHVTSYILRYIGPLAEDEYRQVEAWMRKDDLKPDLRSNLLATLLISGPESQSANVMRSLKEELYAIRNESEAIPHIMTALAQKGDANDRKIVVDMYTNMRDIGSKDYNTDLHATAAYMVLNVLRIVK